MANDYPEIVEAIAKGDLVDWSRALTSAETEEARTSLEALHDMARIVDAHWDVQPPQRWCKLEILENVGEGGFAEVYRAYDERLQRDFALKLMRSPDRVLEEGRHLARVDHPNVARVYGFDEEDGRAGIWMEFIEGNTLGTIRRERGSLRSSEAAAIGIEVARALTAIHDQGMVHGDIKAQNIMQELSGRVVVMDFGLNAGTPIYMAPEVLDGAPPSPESDIYAVGVLLFYLATASFPVEGRDAETLRRAHHSLATRRLHDLDPGLPAVFVDVVEKALAREPSSRFTSAASLEEALGPATKRVGWAATINALWQERVSRVAFALLCLTAVGALLWHVAGTAGAPDAPSSDPMIQESSAPWRVSVAVFQNWTEGEELQRMPYIVQDAIHYQIDQSRFLQAIEPVDDGGNPPLVSVEGNVLRTGGDIRLTAKLYDSRDGRVRTETVEIPGVDGAISEQQLLNGAAQLASSIRVQLEIQATGSASDANEIRKLKTSSVEAYKYFVDAREQYHSRRTAEAIAVLQKALSLDPAFVHAYQLLSDCYYAKGDQERALETLQEALKHPGRLGDEESLRWRLREARIQQQWSIYEDIVEEALVSATQDADWRFTSGWYHVTHSRNYARGISDLQYAMRRDPAREAFFLNHLTYAYLHDGDADNARRDAERYARLDATPYGNDCLGETLFLLGDYERAQSLLEPIATDEADFPHVQKHLGELYYALGQPAKALTALEAYALDREEQNDAWFLQAKIHFLERRDEEARAALANAHYQDFRIIRTWWLSGLLAIRDGELDRAKASLSSMREEVLDRGTNFGAEFYHDLNGSILLEEGLVETAVEEFRAAVSMGPLDRSFFMTRLGAAQASSGRVAEALDTYRRVLEYNASYPTAHVRAGALYEQQGLLDDAAHHYEQALDIWQYAEPEFHLKHATSDALERVR